jgi:uncharacterized protein YjdB
MKFGVAALAVLLAGTMIACGNGSSSSAVSVAINPTSTTLPFGHTQQFTATVKNASNDTVTWEVNGVAGGTSNTGTITTTGLYTAPFTSTSVTVAAVSVADTSQSASASVTVAAPISISPSTAAVSLSGTVQFTATVTFSTNTAVTWQVNGVNGGNASLGTVSTSGLYTAPASAPNPNVLTHKPD